MKRSWFIKKKMAQGQGMTEFALALPILLMLVLGIIEMGRLMFIYSIVTSSSREGVRYASAIGDNGSGTERYRDCAGIEQAVLRLGYLAGITTGDITIEYDEGPGSTVFDTCDTLSQDIELGDRVIVSVDGQYTPMAVIPFFNMPSFTIPSVSRRMIVIQINLEDGGTGGGGTGGGGGGSTTYTPYAPLYVNVTGNPDHNKCDDTTIFWSSNADWTFMPGSDPSTYYITKNYFTNYTTTFPTSQYVIGTLNHNSSTVIEIYADFGTEQSEVLTLSFDCMNGYIINVIHNP